MFGIYNWCYIQMFHVFIFLFIYCNIYLKDYYFNIVAVLLEENNCFDGISIYIKQLILKYLKKQHKYWKSFSVCSRNNFQKRTYIYQFFWLKGSYIFKVGCFCFKHYLFQWICLSVKIDKIFIYPLLIYLFNFVYNGRYCFDKNVEYRRKNFIKT